MWSLEGASLLRRRLERDPRAWGIGPALGEAVCGVLVYYPRPAQTAGPVSAQEHSPTFSTKPHPLLKFGFLFKFSFP